MARYYTAINTEGDSGSGGGSSDPYVSTFNSTTDWSGPSGGFYSILIPQATHEKGLNPTVDVFESVSGNFEEVIVEVIVSSSGNITIRIPDDGTRFVGKLVIL